MAGSRSISKKQLRADAAVLESVVLHHRYATREALEPYKPGGVENPSTDVHGWLRYYIKLQRLHSQAERTAPRATESVAFTASERERMALLRGQAVPVELLARESETSAPTYLHVYPKSLAALTDCYERDIVLGWLTAHFKTLEGDSSAMALECRARLLDEMLYQQRVLAWIVTTPGPRLPFPETAVRPQPPEDLASLDALDVFRIIQAHQLVNSMRLQALSELYDLSNRDDIKRPQWTVWVASVAAEMGVRAETLMNDWSLGELMGQQALASKAQRDAYDAAKQERAS